jgi:hypothetical protein
MAVKISVSGHRFDPCVRANRLKASADTVNMSGASAAIRQPLRQRKIARGWRRK